MNISEAAGTVFLFWVLLGIALRLFRKKLLKFQSCIFWEGDYSCGWFWPFKFVDIHRQRLCNFVMVLHCLTSCVCYACSQPTAHSQCVAHRQQA